MTMLHPFHLVTPSPFPLTAAMGALFTTSGLVTWFWLSNHILVLWGLFILLLSSIQWWRDVTREGTMSGSHTFEVSNGLRWGMILFIISEVMFFFSFFWSFFHSSLSPTLEIGSSWPPSGISPFNPFQIPLLNTVILLSSGASVTWAHHSLIESKHSQTVQSLICTVFLGLYFTLLQSYEYSEASFNISDSIYSSVFFVATGFHGLHVIIGSLFLLVCLYRTIKFHFSPSHHFGFEAAAWYWHFVDVVWLFLYIWIYWWGS